MTTLADSLRDRLDHPRITEQAMFVADTVLHDGEYAFLPYEPGNGTCYSLVFTPVRGAGGWLFVSWLEHGAYRFDFTQVPSPGYVIEKLDRRAGLSDAIALHELFTAIQEAT